MKVIDTHTHVWLDNAEENRQDLIASVAEVPLERVYASGLCGYDQANANGILGITRAKEAGFELSEYVMPGLGGKRWSDRHADDSTSALVEIQPENAAEELPLLLRDPEAVGAWFRREVERFQTQGMVAE